LGFLQATFNLAIAIIENTNNGKRLKLFVKKKTVLLQHRVISLHHNMLMMNRVLAALSCCILLFALSCTKTDSPDGQRGSLQPFNVSVLERNSASAVIQWDSCINTINNEVPKYRVILRDRVIHSNLSVLADSLIGLHKDTVYNGKVVAYISTGDTVFSSFTISTYDGVVYAATYSSGSNTGRLGCFNTYSTPGVYPPSSIWRVNIPYNSTSSYVSTFTISNDTLFTIAGTRLIAVNARNGSIIWQASTSLNLLSPATYYNGRLYACTNLGLVAINSANGQTIWTYSSPITSVTFDSAPVVDGGKVFVATTSYSQAQLHAVDALSGTRVWSTGINESICKKPLAANGVLVILSNVNASVTAFNSNTGMVLWTKTGLGPNTGAEEFNPVFSDGNVLVNLRGPLYAFNLQTGTKVWELDGANTIKECVVGNGMVCFSLEQTGTYNSTLYGVNGKTGRVVWNSLLTSQAIHTQLIFAKDRLYCVMGYSGTTSNVFGSFNAFTGVFEQSLQSPNPVYLNLFENIFAIAIKRDGIVYYPSSAPVNILTYRNDGIGCK
jgi:hypothetical protein